MVVVVQNALVTNRDKIIEDTLQHAIFAVLPKHIDLHTYGIHKIASFVHLTSGYCLSPAA